MRINVNGELICFIKFANDQVIIEENPFKKKTDKHDQWKSKGTRHEDKC